MSHYNVNYFLIKVNNKEVPDTEKEHCPFHVDKNVDLSTRGTWHHYFSIIYSIIYTNTYTNIYTNILVFLRCNIGQDGVAVVYFYLR